MLPLFVSAAYGMKKAYDSATTEGGKLNQLGNFIKDEAGFGDPRQPNISGGPLALDPGAQQGQQYWMDTLAGNNQLLNEAQGRQNELATIEAARTAATQRGVTPMQAMYAAQVAQQQQQSANYRGYLDTLNRMQSQAATGLMGEGQAARRDELNRQKYYDDAIAAGDQANRETRGKVYGAVGEGVRTYATG